MSGAVAAGNKHSAEAGAWALREGGTAVDAALAATFAAFVTEGPLTGPAGGGFLLLHEPGAGAVVLDCFFTVPAGARAEMDEVVIDFGDASTQVFHIGEASVAVPGLLPGLVEAHARRGRLAWEQLFVPSLELAHRGVEPDPAQAFLLEVLVPILQREPAGRRIYGTAGRIDGRDLVPTLDVLRGARSEAIPMLLPELAADLLAYVVETRGPLEASIGGATVLTTPAPSLGGTVVQAGRSTSYPTTRQVLRPRRGRSRPPSWRGTALPDRSPPTERVRPGRPTSRRSTATEPRSRSLRLWDRGRGCSDMAFSSTTCSASST